MSAQPGYDGKNTKSGIKKSGFKSSFAKDQLSHLKQNTIPC